MERLRVSDFTGAEWMQAECDALGIADDAAACRRFDAAFHDEMERVGGRNANALKVLTGLGYDTCQKLLVEPHKQSRRVLWVVCSNLDVDLSGIEQKALVDADAEGFDAAYDAGLQGLYLLAFDYLRLSEQEQAMVRKLAHAAVGGYPSGSERHVAACSLLREQIGELVGLRPDRSIVIEYDG